MQYATDTLSIEISKLETNIRKLKTHVPEDAETRDYIEIRIKEFEANIRVLKQAIGVLRDYQRSGDGQYQQRNYGYQQR